MCALGPAPRLPNPPAIPSLKSFFSSVQWLSHVLLFAAPWTVHHQLPEIAQTHVHSVGDAIHPSHSLLSPSPSSFNLSSIRVFSKRLILHIRWTTYWSFSISPSNEYSALICFKMGWFDPFVVQGTQESSPTPQFKTINSSVLNFLYSPALTSIHDYW